MADVIGGDGGWLTAHVRSASQSALKRAGGLIAASHVEGPPDLAIDYDPDEPRNERGEWGALIGKQRELEGVRAAIRTPSGKIYTGRDHREAEASMPPGEDGDAGFVVLSTGEFIGRREADRRLGRRSAEGIEQEKGRVASLIQQFHQRDAIADKHRQTGLRASVAAFRQTPTHSPIPTLDACQAVSVGALADVCSDAVDEATRAVYAHLMTGRPRPKAIRDAVMGALGRGASRTKTLVEHALSQAVAQSTLDAFEDAGFTHVGTLSERRQAMDAWAVVRRADGRIEVREVPDDEIDDYDPSEPRDPNGRWSGSSPEWEAKSEDEKAKFVARARPAVRSIATGKVTLGHRGQTHRDLGFDVEDPGDDERGFVDPLTGKFHSGADVPLDSSDLMTPDERVLAFGRDAAFEDFDPSEPRDPEGKWTTSAGGPAGPYLIPTILWKGKKYYGATHAGAAHSDPTLLKELTAVNWSDDRVIRYTTPEGKLLNRYEAHEYAKQTGIIDPHILGANQPDLISEVLKPEAADPSHLLFRRQMGEHGLTAISPSTHELDLVGAVFALSGAQQKSMEQASAEIDQGLGVEAKDIGVVGAWKDGAENALATLTNHVDWDTLKTSAAMKAHLSNQKAALVFLQGDGDSALYRLHATGDVASIHAGLLADGVANHSIAPDPDGKGATVYVVDLDGSAYHGVAKAAERFNAKVTYQIGRAEFVGSDGEGSDADQRAHAREAYEGVIRESKVPAVADLWARVHARWGQSFQDAIQWLIDAARKNAQPQHPRTGRFATAAVVARERRRHKGTGQFRRQGPEEGTQARAERAQAAFGKVSGRVDVATQGDDRVCDVCDGIADNGPYTISRARSLIPAHPNCRCVFVAARSMRDALMEGSYARVA
jgi:hypothetical protein